MEKIGIGVLTYKRKDVLATLLKNLAVHCKYDYLLISNDEYDNVGVAGNSNRLLKGLYDLGCEYIFLINDDEFPMGDVTSLYIDASKKTGAVW